MKHLLTSLIAILLALTVAEGILRILGQEPGLIVDTAPFERTDSLFVYKDYTADENGILKFSESGRQYVAQGIAHQGTVPEAPYILINMLIDDFIAVEEGKVDNAFARFIQRLERKPVDSLDEVDKACLAYVKSPINSDGFRSIEFRPYYETGKPRILLLGDSHTYGAEASNITYSFADQLSAKGYVVYNTGVVATDPAQYLAVAKKYIPKLQPDVVIVSFCLNNDIVYFKRQPEPYQKVFYATNVGNLMACPDGEYLRTPEEAYHFILEECYIPNQDRYWFNHFAAATVLGTKLWIALRKLGWLQQSDPEREAYFKRTARLKSDKAVSDYFLEKIKNIAEKHGAKFILAAIPDGDDLDKRPEDVPGLFENITYHIPEQTGPEDRSEGGHFNDQGYTKYTDFLDHLIREKLDGTK